MQLLDHEKKHLATLRPVLAECTVLLKNDGSFPLKSPCPIAAFGNGVRRTIKGGKGSGEVNSRYFVNIESGLEEAGFKVITKNWLDAYDKERSEAKKRFIAEAKKEARAHHQMAVFYCMGMTMAEPEHEIALETDNNQIIDTAIYVLSRDSGEGNDRRPIKGDVLLTDSERRDILKLNDTYRRFMLVLNTGGPVDLSGLESVKNILVLSQLGVETGSALADILLGRQNPSGKLATTWTAWSDYPSIGDFGDRNDTYYREGIYVGYRYFDSAGKKALYPFGFGLSYTKFKIDPQPAELSGSKVCVSATVSNIGKYTGKEVFQVYVSCPQGKLDKAYQDLVGFAKTSLLKPGQAQDISVQFDLRDCASYDDEKAAFVLEKGSYIIRVGNSSVHTMPIAVVQLDSEAVVRKVRNCCGKPDFKDWKPEISPDHEVPSYIPTLKLNASDIDTETVYYEKNYPINEAVLKLSDEQLALAATGGAFTGGSKAQELIGNASSKVAGAAGESTPRLAAEGFEAIVMADGPAGLRLTPLFYRDAKGAHAINGGGHSESFMEFLPGIVKWFMKISRGKSKVPAGAESGTQWCTAIPIGTAIAQSWDTELARLCGDIVGSEMELFNIQLWLAPALNIHRSILCGRNFEYFSEDPLISGKIAASITNGVQTHPGCGTTIKHYATNNQETNRYGNNTNISERALREIYLKGFGIAVKESQPKAVMSSYNLLNGTHTAESRDLIDSILRCEFGFEGIVMTDWWVASGLMNSKADIHPTVTPKLTAAAGSDLFMPGCKADYLNILKGLKDGSLSRKQLQINATRVYQMGKELSDEIASRV